MGASPLFTTGATYLAGAGGAAGAGAGMAALANPITAALAAAAIGTAYGVSPKFRNATNKVVKGGYEAFTNPFQHFGDGSDKDRFGNLLGQQQQNQQRQNQQRQNNSNAPYGIAGNGWGSSMIPVSGLSPSMPRPAVPFYESRLLPAPFKQRGGLAALQQLNNEMTY